jgi:hypothetical protein
MRSTDASFHGWPTTACSASPMRSGVAATPPKTTRACRTRPDPSRSYAIAAATVLMSSNRRFETL